jgi:hypothetical protein
MTGIQLLILAMGLSMVSQALLIFKVQKNQRKTQAIEHLALAIAINQGSR